MAEFRWPRDEIKTGDAIECGQRARANLKKKEPE
jgi:hypothetical protein